MDLDGFNDFPGTDYIDVVDLIQRALNLHDAGRAGVLSAN